MNERKNKQDVGRRFFVWTKNRKVRLSVCLLGVSACVAQIITIFFVNPLFVFIQMATFSGATNFYFVECNDDHFLNSTNCKDNILENFALSSTSDPKCLELV